MTGAQRQQAAESLRRYWKEHPKQHQENANRSQKGKHKKRKTIQTFFDLPARTRCKIIQRLKVACFNCGWGEEVGDVHHIIPKAKGGSNSHDNLTYLCPNCHRLVHKGKLQSTNLKSFQKVVGEQWKALYYG